MKNKLFRNLFALTLTLLVALAFAACTPEIHIHTGESSNSSVTSDEATVASTEGKTENTENTTDTKPEPDTSIASSETQKSSNKSQGGSTASKSTASKSTSSKSTSSKSTSSKSTSSKSSGSSTISTSKAKSIALKDAGLTASDIYDYEIELDRDQGALHYDVSFEYNGKDYDYEINASTGKIISVDKPNATSSEVKISKSKAKSTALNHAGVKAADISRYQIELEKDNSIWKYEISFNVGNVEYDYTINAETGKILHSEKDIDD